MEYFLADTKESLTLFDTFKLEHPQLQLLNHYAYPNFDHDRYIFNSNNFNQYEIENIINFSSDWYHSKCGDVTLYNGFSWGPTLGSNMLLQLPFLYKEYIAFKKLRFNIIWISSNESLEFKKLMEYFYKDKVRFYQVATCPRLIDLYSKRSLQMPRKDFRFSFLALIKKILLFKHPVTLFLAEGSLLSYFDKKEDVYYLNTKNIKKGIYQNAPSSYTASLKFIPPWLTDSQFYHKHFFRHNTEAQLNIDPDFLTFFAISTSQSIADKKTTLSAWISFYISLLENYSIKEIVFAGERIEYLSLGIEVANIYKAKKIHIIDGVAYGKRILYFYNKNFKSIFNFSITFNPESYATLSKNNPVLDKIILEEQPHPMLLKTPAVKKSVYDVIVFAPISLEYSISSLPDYSPITLDLLIKKLTAAGLKVAIKFKNVNIMQYYKDFLTDEIYQDIPSLTCTPSEAFSFTKAIVTGVSTTIAEAEAHKTPCFVYEAYGSGYFKDFLSEEFFGRRTLYLNPDILTSEIKKELTVKNF
ncbi:MAG: hypothetical protein H7336_02645 [Bacteriovorax sp.]|nr:hypothetical protein [Bacteriovorax sp.]